ncbi:MAG: c-type cytochrome, partial [Planctomycetota bacterium]
MLPTVLVIAFVITPCLAEDLATRGERLYFEQCASCHGNDGQGVEGKYDDPLIGDKSLPRLISYTHKWMPEEDPDLCLGDVAKAVSRYIYDRFYSAKAQARRQSPRIELSHITSRQYRQSVADLVGSFRDQHPLTSERGLHGAYYQSKSLRDKITERVEPQIRFIFGSQTAPDEREWTVIDNQSRDNKGFGARWQGALIAPDTGKYQI